MSIKEPIALTVRENTPLSPLFGTPSGGGHGLQIFTAGNPHAHGLESNVKE